MRAADAAKRLVKRRLPVAAQERLRRAAASARRPVRAARRRRADVYDEAALLADLVRGGVRAGDLLMVHAALSRVGNVRGGAPAVVRSLLAAVGSEGTVLAPAFLDADAVLRESAAGRPVDLRSARSSTGAVAETLRTWPGARRSSHPFSSVAAVGARAAELTAGHEDDARIAHVTSPMGRLWQASGRIMGLGVDLGPVSFYHVLEDTWDGFPFPTSLPPEPVTYVDATGHRVERDVRRYDPTLRTARIDHPSARRLRAGLAEHLEAAGILTRFTYGAAPAWVMDARPLYEELQRLASRGETIYMAESRPGRLRGGT